MNFVLNQALFGYDGGHQLLASSLRLPTEARHFLAKNTDISGSAPPSGFDQSYTGVPVPGTQFYALFCTWLAPEMPRPGCVWTHVLLIDLADLAELTDLGALRSCFLRPASPPILNDFSRSLCFTDKPYSILKLPASVESQAAAVISSLYLDAKRSVVVAAQDSYANEDLSFALWSQQWPRLRRNFRFSTGSFADRGRGGADFDLQVTPESNLRAWSRNEIHLISRNSAETIGQPSENPWIRHTLDDLRLPDFCNLRTFLRTYGADVSAPREAFTSLVRWHAEFSESQVDSWSSALRSIARDFPAPEEAGTLKLASVSKFSDDSFERTLNHMVESVEFLNLEDTSGAFAQVPFDFVSTLKLVWPERRSTIAAILSKPPLTEERWTQLATAAAQRMRDDEIEWLWTNYPALLAPFVRFRPEIASTENAWKLSERGQWSVVEALESSAVSPALWRDIVRAMLSAETVVGAREIAMRAGAAAFQGIVRLFEERPAAMLPSLLWRETLRPLAERRLSEPALSPLELAVCSIIAPQTVIDRAQFLQADLMGLAKVPLGDLPLCLRLPTAFVLVTIGLQSSLETGAPLLAASFFEVHEALEGKSDPPEAWRILQPHLPRLWPWQEWDRCKKMRRALEEWINKFPQAIKAILASARTEEERGWLASLD